MPILSGSSCIGRNWLFTHDISKYIMEVRATRERDQPGRAVGHLHGETHDIKEVK